jgi:ATP-dependent Lon protease
VGLELLQRQYLLELLSENERLQWLVEHLKAILPRLEAAEEFFRRVRGNGHFAP